MDKLKYYLLRHRSDLDVDRPPSDTWEYPLSPERPKSSRRVVWYMAAACVTVLAGTGLWLVTRSDKGPADMAKRGTIVKERAPEKDSIESPSLRKEKTPDKDLAKNASTPKGVLRHNPRPLKREAPADAIDGTDSIGAIDAIDRSYSSLIHYQLTKLRSTPLYAESGSYFSFYIQQFKQMDQDEQQVRNDIKTYGLTSEFLEQLINVYQQKLNMLKNLETEINKMNNKVREKAAPSTKTEVYYLDI